MANNNGFIMNLPSFLQKEPNPPTNGKQKNNNIDQLRNSIKSQYDELLSFQDIELTKENIRNIEKLILATEDLINNCMNDEIYSGNRDQYFVNLIFICHKLSLRIETYKLEEKIKDLDTKNTLISENQERLQKMQEKSEEQSNNLVYNILGFIASFSIVSAAVTAISNIQGTLNIVLFMTFCVFILFTTLIGLNNFYKNNSNKKWLGDNYFLWRLLLFIIIVLVVFIGIKYLKNNIWI